MKKTLAIALIMGAALQVAVAGNISLFGSYWDAKDMDDPLLGGGLKFDVGINPNLAFQVRASYLEGDVDSEGGLTISLISIPLEVGLKYNFMPQEQLNAYVGGGLGYYMFATGWKGPGIDETESADNEIGFYAVGGVDFQVGERVSLFAEAKYTMVEVKKTDIPSEFGGGAVEIDDGSLDGIGVNVGITFTW